MRQRSLLATIPMSLAILVLLFASSALLAQDSEETSPTEETAAAPAEAPAASPIAEADAPAEGAEEEGPKIKRNAEGVPLVSVPYMRPAPMTIVLDDFRSQTGLSVIPKGDKAGKMDVVVSGEDLTPEEFLTLLADQNGLVWRKKGDAYEIMDPDYFKNVVVKEMTETKIFVPVHITAPYLSEAIERSNILTPETGSVSLDERTNQVIVTDLPERLAMVQDLLNLLDVAQVTRVFRIRYGDIVAIGEKTKEFKSQPGMIDVDPKNRLIVVRDILANIQRMESVIELLDVRQMRRVYNINVSSDADLDALQNALDDLKTPDAKFQIDGLRGMFWLEDTPEVHTDVQRFLQVFNRPIDQVLIQAELLDVSQDNLLRYGMELSYSGDLAAAVQDKLISNYPTIGSAAGASPGAPFGFIDFRKEFPLGSVGASGLTVGHLSRHVKAQLTAALTDSNTQVLLKPRVLAKNGEKVRIFSGSKEPVINLQPLGTEGSLTQQFGVSQSTVEAGLEVQLTPTISPTGLVTIDLLIKNSSAEPVSLPTGLTTNPILPSIRTREDSADTTLIIPDGETRVISGLIRRDRSDRIQGVPFLVQIPWIGPLLFGSSEKNDDTRNLLFFITPTIIRERGVGSVVALDLDEVEPTGRWLGIEETLGAPTSWTDDAVSTLPLTYEAWAEEETQPAAEPEEEVEEELAPLVLPSPDERFPAPLPEGEPAPSTETFEAIPEVPEAEEEEPTSETVQPPAGETLPDTETEMSRLLMEKGGRMPDSLRAGIEEKRPGAEDHGLRLRLGPRAPATFPAPGLAPPSGEGAPGIPTPPGQPRRPLPGPPPGFVPPGAPPPAATPPPAEPAAGPGEGAAPTSASEQTERPSRFRTSKDQSE